MCPFVFQCRCGVSFLPTFSSLFNILFFLLVRLLHFPFSFLLSSLIFFLFSLLFSSFTLFYSIFLPFYTVFIFCLFLFFFFLLCFLLVKPLHFPFSFLSPSLIYLPFFLLFLLFFFLCFIFHHLRNDFIFLLLLFRLFPFPPLLLFASLFLLFLSVSSLIYLRHSF